MTARAYLVLSDALMRAKAIRWVAGVPLGTRVEFRAPRRTLDQNAKFWALLGELSAQVEHGGRKYPPGVWKHLILHSLGRETQFVPSLDGHEILPIGSSSSDLSKSEMSDAIELIHQFGAEHGVVFKEPREEAA